MLKNKEKSSRAIYWNCYEIIMLIVRKKQYLRCLTRSLYCGRLWRHGCDKFIPVPESSLNLKNMPFPLIAIFLSQLRRQFLDQSKCYVHRLKILRLDM